MFDGFDMGQLMAQAQKLQEDLLQAQEDLAAQSFTGSAGGDLVVMTVSGKGELTDVRLAPEVVDPSDIETLQDLIVAAFRAAKDAVDEAAAASMPQLPPGMGM
ncbi:MAG TPA: YbaB/EbfC family nucleoid-associated protein [Arachnia sp.]|nr:YbaB/EbfC family nucleoid-associated protein [Arachnia sp.]HMT86854.1 YbaB/EbfC family nucleoid-associated protein [Arachnia sp.]